VAGAIEFDMTFLKALIKVQPPVKPGRMSFWRIQAILRIFVSGRNLRYEVSLPGDNTRIHGVGQECIAAAFRPGTE